MPRPNKPRAIFAERHVAANVRQLREAQSPPWSVEGLASRMTDAGCSIQPSALYKLERADPPRRVTVDELVALSRVFDVPIADLVADPEKQWPARAWELYERSMLAHARWQAAQRVADAANAEHHDLVVEFMDLLGSHPEIKDEVDVMIGTSEDDEARQRANIEAYELALGTARPTRRRSKS